MPCQCARYSRWRWSRRLPPLRSQWHIAAASARSWSSPISHPPTGRAPPRARGNVAGPQAAAEIHRPRHPAFHRARTGAEPPTPAAVGRIPGIELAIAMAYAREYLYGPMNFEAIRLHAPWNQPNVPLLVGSLVLLFFALIGARAVFAMPIALTANWIFRVTAVHSPAAYFRAVRKSLFALAALPVWIGAAILFFAIWPPAAAMQRVALMVVVGVLVVEKSLRWFRKIPFACSYLPGKANLHVRLGAYGAGSCLSPTKGWNWSFGPCTAPPASPSYSPSCWRRRFGRGAARSRRRE